MTSNKVQDIKEGDQYEYGKPNTYDPDFNGPVKSRSCTDILCLLLFISFIGGWIAIAVVAGINGDPSRLLRPTDSRGQVCGRDEIVKDKPFLYFFDLTRCASASVILNGCPTTQVCVKECPQDNWFYNPLSSEDKDKLLCNYDVDTSKYTTKELIEQSLCAPYYIESKEIKKRCLPMNMTQHVKEIFNSILDATEDASDQPELVTNGMKYVLRFVKFQQVAEGAFQDIKNTWYLILIGCVIAMLISGLWIFLLRLIAGFMIWFSIFAFTAISCFSAYYTMNKYLTLRNQEQNDALSITEITFSREFSKYAELETTWLVLFILTVVVLLVCLIVLIFLRKKVNVAIALIGEASKAVGDITSSVFLPIIPYILQLISFVMFLSVAVLLSSSGKPKYKVTCENNCTSCPDILMNDPCNPDDYNDGKNPCTEATCQFISYFVETYIPYLHAYNAFALLWMLFFTAALGQMVLAGAFSIWYWTFDKKNVPNGTILHSLQRTLGNHVGTLAFGSLIITIVRAIRYLLEAINKKVKQHSDNQLAKAVICCCRCCLWCLEKFLKFVNRNAYIYCAIYGKNFCTSAKNSFFLLMRNITGVVIVDNVADFLLLIGKLVVTGSIGLASFFVFSREVPYLTETLPAMNYYLTPVIIITLATFYIACAFFSVYEMAVDTLFLCFLEDKERNDGSQSRPYYMSKDLMKLLHKTNLKEEEK